jgi:uncharacterized protein YjiS (DUF1127 family)
MKRIHANFSYSLIPAEQPVLGPLLMTLVRRTRAWLARRAVREELERLDSRSLLDLGINAGDFDAIASGTYQRREAAAIARDVAAEMPGMPARPSLRPLQPYY